MEGVKRFCLFKDDSKSKITTSDFKPYLKSVNDPECVFDQADYDVLYFNERYLNDEIDVMFMEINLSFSTEKNVKARKNLNIENSAGSDYLLNEFFFKYGS